MFKRRLIETFGFLLVGVIFLLFMGLFIWLISVNIAGAIVLVACALFILSAVAYYVTRFIKWLIVEPYRAYKRERETEGTAE
ncbi:hypothetical protein BSF20_19295 [Bacillus amyloliquefaciens]|uniref:hypothetical protein n=1 Tax=Bacillus amyloliquefaciens TaxID=1390 RepID=UPI00090B081D|nr:hypothetical protein [Bacillus amyloliquefaciens]APH50440.1 hypothetical protein BSF20_19295 [Bacillus amyloliquefaciens]